MTDYTTGSTYPASRIAGNVNQGGLELTCILSEGNLTVTANTHGPDGYTDTGITAASGLKKDQWVTLDVDSANTYIATYGLPVVKAITNGSLIIGKITSTPVWASTLPTSTQTTWSTMLSSKYFRIATVWFPGITGAEKMVVAGASAANIVPGVQATLQFDATATTALSTADGVVTLSGVDAANGGVGAISFHYVASGGHTQYILVGFTGGVVTIAA